MSRSNYNTVEDRDYESRRERERERSRNADRYDGETRHHGKWTASGEATDLETGSSSFHKERRAGGLGNRSYSDREVLDSDRHDRNRSSSNLGYNSGFGSNYDSYGSSSNYGSSSIPVPPPMPPADFYQPHGSYRSTSGLGNHYGSGLGGLGHSGYGNQYGSGYDHSYGSSGYGSHYGSGLGGLGGLGHSGYGSSYGHPSYGTGYGSHYGSGLGHSGYGSSYGHPSYGTGFGHPTQLASLPHTYGPGYQATQIYGSDYYFGQPGYGQSSSSSLGSRSRGLGGLGGLGGRKRFGPKTDIYELGNDYVIEMDLPGHQRDHIDIKLAGNELYVISKPPARTHNFHINERSLGRSHVERKFYLPADVTTTSIAPVLTNGVLRLVLPRSALATTTPLANPTSVLSSGVKPHGTTVTDTITTSTSTNQVVV